MATVRSELKAHVANLPDEDTAADVGGAALPSVQDLFGDGDDDLLEPQAEASVSVISSKTPSRRGSLALGAKRPKLGDG